LLATECIQKNEFNDKEELEVLVTPIKEYIFKITNFIRNIQDFIEKNKAEVAYFTELMVIEQAFSL
jgi:hypothetical protein